MPDISKIKLKGITYDIKDTEARNGISNIDTITQARVDEITDYTPESFPSPVYAYETIADMQADTSLQEGMIAHTNGFHATGDGGAAYYNISVSGIPNDMDILTLENGLYATLMVIDSYVTPEMFGAYGDGTHDDTVAIQVALDSGNPVNGSNTYNLTSVDVTGCDLSLENVGSCSIISDGTQTAPCNVHIGQATILTLGTFKNSTFDFGYIDTLNIAPNNSFAYCHLNWGRCNTLNIGVHDSNVWVNENKFVGRITSAIHFLGTYNHNCNIIECSAEGSSFVIDSESGVHDNIIKLYGENVNLSNINLTNGFNNAIQFMYSAVSGGDRNSMAGSANGCRISKPSSLDLLKPLLLEHLEDVDQSAGTSITAYTDIANYLIEVAENETVYIQFNADDALFRNGVYAYDASMNAISIANVFSNPPQSICNTWGVNSSTPNRMNATINRSSDYATLPYVSDIKYWRFNVRSNASGTVKFADVKIFSTGYVSRVSKLETVI